MIQAIIDTNVIVSALLSKNPSQSIPFLVMSYGLEGFYSFVISEKTFNEYKEVLGRDKFQFNKNYVDVLLNGIYQHSIVLNPQNTECELPDEKDRAFYDLLVASPDNTFLVTGNEKHFPKGENTISPRKFIELLSEIR